MAQGFVIFAARTGGLVRLPLREERAVLASKQTVVVFGAGVAGGDEEDEEDRTMQEETASRAERSRRLWRRGALRRG